MEKNRQRIYSLDIAKALCIVLVVVGHFNPDNAPAWWKCINQIIYSFHIPLFLFVSGYVYRHTLRKQSYSTFMEKKCRRLAVPYLITSAIIISIILLSHGNVQTSSPVTPFTFVEMLYLPAAGYFLWFVWALLLMFAIVWFAKGKKARMALLVASVALYYLPLDFPDLFCLRQFKMMMLYFMMGVVSAESDLKKIFNCAWANFVYIPLFGFAFYLWADMGDNYVPIMAVTGILLVLATSKWLEKLQFVKHSILLPLSAASYTIYLYHTTFMGFAKAFCAKLHLAVHFELEACLVVLCGVVCPLLLHWAIKRFRVGKIMLGLG